MRSPWTATNSSSHSPQLEKACVQQQRPNAAKINKYNKFIYIYKKNSRARFWLAQKGWVSTLNQSAVARSGVPHQLQSWSGRETPCSPIALCAWRCLLGKQKSVLITELSRERTGFIFLHIFLLRSWNYSLSHTLVFSIIFVRQRRWASDPF